MDENLTKFNRLLFSIQREGFKVETYKKYGQYFIEFETTGLKVYELNKIIELLPLFAVITHSENGCLCINTMININ